MLDSTWNFDFNLKNVKIKAFWENYQSCLSHSLVKIKEKLHRIELNHVDTS
jgi:hypothetical protein